MDFDTLLAQYTFAKVFLKGPPGSGKTHLAAAAAGVWKTLYIDVDGGLYSAFGSVRKENIVVRLIREPESDQFFGKLAEAVMEAESGQYECVVLDSLTKVSERMEDDYASKSQTGKVEFGDWYVLQSRLRKLVTRLKNAPCHVIVTCITKPTGKEEGSSIFEPVLPGQSSATLPSQFETVGLLRLVTTKAGNEYVVSTQGPAIYQVRDRYRALSPDEKISEKEGWRIWEKMQKGIQSLPSRSAVPATK